MNPLFGFFGLDPIHWVIIAVVGMLLFGKRLPEFGRVLAKGILEFKRGLSGLEDEITGGSVPPGLASPAQALRPPQRVTAPAPTFEDNAGAASNNVRPPHAV